MRPKFVFALLLAAVLVVGGAFYLKNYFGNSPAPAPQVSPETAAVPAAISAAAPTAISGAVPNVVTNVALPPTPLPVATPVATNVLTPEQRQAAIDAETDRLYQWSMNDDPASLSNILADLTNSDKEIREAAIDAAKQFGSASAIPALKAAAADTSDTEDQIAMLEAAQFLSLPEVDFGNPGTAMPKTPEQIQLDQQKQAARDARRLQKIGPASDQNSQTPPAQSSGSNQ